MLSHREISTRSERVSACLARCRPGGRMPPVGEITEKTDEDSRSNRRPIDSSTRQPASDPRSQTAEPQINRCGVTASCPHSISAKRLECCTDRLSPPQIAVSLKASRNFPLYTKKPSPMRGPAPPEAERPAVSWCL